MIADIDVVHSVQCVADDFRFGVESVHAVPYWRLRRRAADDRLGRVTGETQVHDADESGKHNDSSGGSAEQRWLSGLWASVSSYTTRGEDREERENMDMAHIMRQLGVMPAAATA